MAREGVPTCDGIVGVDTWRPLTGRPAGNLPEARSVDSSRAFVISVDHTTQSVQHTFIRATPL
jgi:hypothetical protein